MNTIAKHSRDIAWKAVRDARKLLGDGWAHMAAEASELDDMGHPVSMCKCTK